MYKPETFCIVYKKNEPLLSLLDEAFIPCQVTPRFSIYMQYISIFTLETCYRVYIKKEPLLSLLNAAFISCQVTTLLSLYISIGIL